MKGNYKPHITRDDILTVNSSSAMQQMEDGKVSLESPRLNGKTSRNRHSNTYGKPSFANVPYLGEAGELASRQHQQDKNVASKEQQIPHHHHHHQLRPPASTSGAQVRHYMALLGLSIAVVNLYAQNTFFIAIVEMVLPPDQTTQARPASQHLPSTTLTILSSNNMTTVASTAPFSASWPLEDQSCPIEFKYRDYYDKWRFSDGAINPEAAHKQQPSAVSSNLDDRFDWDAGMQGVLLGACAVGTAPLQILSGRLAEIYGPKWVLMSAGVGTALTNLLVPALARYSFNLLVVNRILMGVSQAGLEPAIVCLMASWLTPSERGFFLSLLLFAICFGSFVGMLVTTMILSLGYHWATTFYVAGYLNLAVSALWLLFSSNRPADSKLLSTGELNYILASQLESAGASTNELAMSAAQDCSGSGQYLPATTSTTSSRLTEDVSQAPWGRILSCRAVWAFIICKVSTRWCADVVASELPTYLANVLHLSIKLNGIVNSVSAGLFAVFSLLTGYLVNEISRSRERALQANRPPRLSKTNLRKIFQALGSFGSTLNLLLMVRYDCDLLLSIVMLLVLSCALVLGAGGELQIPYDMSSKYPGTLHGIACTLAVSGWLAPPTIGLILSDQPTSRYRWSIVWHLTAAINFIGGLVFVLFADASARDFDLDSPKSTGARSQVAARPCSSSSGPARGDYKKKEPAAAACYVNVVCELAERGREPALGGQRQPPPTTTGSPGRAGAGSGPAAREPPMQELWKLANNNHRRQQQQPDGPLFQTSDGPCVPTQQVTRAGAPPGNWWLLNERASRLWAKLAGRHGKFSVSASLSGQPEDR